MKMTVYFENPPNHNQLAFKTHPIFFLYLLCILYIICFIFNYFYLFSTITVTPNTYPRSLSGSRLTWQTLIGLVLYVVGF